MTRLNQFDIQQIRNVVEGELETKYRAFLQGNFLLRSQLTSGLVKAIQKQTEREMQDEVEGLVYSPAKIALTSDRNMVTVLCLVKNQKFKGIGRSVTRGQTTSFAAKLPANLVFELQKLEKMKEYL